MIDVKEKFRKRVLEKGLTQKDVIQSIGMTEGGFWQMINKGSMKVSTLKKLASILDVDYDFLIDESVTNPKRKSSVESQKFGAETVEFLQEQLREKDHTIRKLLEHLGPVAAGKLKVYPPEERLQPMSGQLKVA